VTAVATGRARRRTIVRVRRQGEKVELTCGRDGRALRAWRTHNRTRRLRCRPQDLACPTVGRGRLPRAVQGPVTNSHRVRSARLSDLCESRDLDPLAATRSHIEPYVRWLQEVRRYRPSTVSRRMSMVAGFYRTCVIDSVLEHSPAEYVRRPNVPAESPTLGLTHLQFDALLSTAKHSSNRCDFALGGRVHGRGG